MPKPIAFKDLCTLLKNKKIRSIQLIDGTIHLYSFRFLMATFSYYGSKHINNLTLNTKPFIGKPFYRTLHLSDSWMQYGDQLAELLRVRFPNAHLCKGGLKYAVEFSIIESAIGDKSIVVEFDHYNRYGCDVYVMGSVENGFVSCSFCWLWSDKIAHVYIRTGGQAKLMKVREITVPEWKKESIRAMLIDRGMKDGLD